MFGEIQVGEAIGVTGTEHLNDVVNREEIGNQVKGGDIAVVVDIGDGFR